MSFKRNSTFFVIGIIISASAFFTEYAVTNQLDQNQERDLISFVKDFLEEKNNLFLIVFIIGFPVGLFAFFQPKLIYFSYATVLVTGYAWFGVLIMIIDNWL